MLLQDLLQDIPTLVCTAPLTLDITDVHYDSRSVTPGSLFVAVTGYATDGHRYIDAAREKGAVAVLCEKKPDADIPYVLVKNSRRALARLGDNFFRHPSQGLTMLAVTGTNGKTTSTYLLKHVLEQTLGAKVGLIGTNQNLIGEEVIPTERTTPESFELHRLFRRMADAGCTHVVMEVSSHALFEDRVYGIDYALSVFTNLTQDHLDFHKTMENYCDAKALLFRQSRVGVVNADDPWRERLLKNVLSRNVTYGIQSAADYRAENVRLSADRVSYTLVHGGREQSVSAPLPGAFNVYNSLGVLAAAEELGIDPAAAAEALAHACGVKGRAEVVPTPGKPYTVLIDYAHTPDGLENILRTVRGFAAGRVIAVFGCGGDRDRTKRPQMGAVAAELADFSVVTSDNPRTEEPMSIIRDILPGFAGRESAYTVVENRAAAIRYAMEHAEAQDVIVLCGKGHETYQEINGVRRPLDERLIVADCLS